MVPTPFFDGGVGQTHDMEAEHGESSPEEGVGDAGGDDPELLELTRLLNSVCQRRGRDISGILTAAGSRGTPLLGADELEALASIDSSVRRHEECGKGPISGLNRGDTQAAASNIPRAPPIATDENPHAFTNDHHEPSPQPTSQPATPPQAVGHAKAVAHRGPLNGGLYTNRLKKERDHINNTNGGAPGPVPAAQPTRVGVHDQRNDTYRTRGAAYRGHGAGAAEGFQARGVKRERNVPLMTLIIDYDPERSGEGLIRGMPSPDEIVVHAKMAMDLLLRNGAARGVTLFPSNTVRNEALRIILRATHDVSYVQVCYAMSKTEYSTKVNKVWTKFRNDSSSMARYTIVCGLGIDVVGTGLYKYELDTARKAECNSDPIYPLHWVAEEHLGHKVSSWSHEKGDKRPFTSALFFAACKAAYPEWVTADGILVLVPYHIAWVLFSFDYGMTNMRDKSMTLSQSPLTNEREMVEVLAEVETAIKMWLAVAKGRLYVPEMGAFKWGEAGLFINESGFNEYLPEEYQVRPASHVGDEGPWME
ncbi:unnamed protein product [Closterium sp. NIES-64]|nr:unnamed protein product [Closterium sp. NIES-64]